MMYLLFFDTRLIDDRTITIALSALQGCESGGIII